MRPTSASLSSGVLEDEGYAVRSAADSSAALEAIEDRRPSLVLLDVWLQGSKLDGLQLLEQIKRRDPTLPVLMISGHGNLDTAVAAIREGAVDFIEKPFKADRLLHLVGRGDRDRPLAPRESRSSASRSARDDQLDGTLGCDQHGARDPEAGRADRKPGDDHGPGRRRQGNRRADDP